MNEPNQNARQLLRDERARQRIAGNSKEALSWLQSYGDGVRSLSGSEGNSGEHFYANETAINLIKLIYQLGAIKIHAVDIDDYEAEDQDTDTLFIELPNDELQRAKIFEFVNDFATKRGWDATKDENQKFLLM